MLSPRREARECLAKVELKVLVRVSCQRKTAEIKDAGSATLRKIPSLFFFLALTISFSSEAYSQGCQTSPLVEKITKMSSDLEQLGNREARDKAALQQGQDALRAAQEAKDVQAEQISQRAIELSKEALDKAQQKRADLAANLNSTCSTADKQLQTDLEAMRRQKRTIDATLGELDEWTKENEKAQWDALMEGANVIAGRFASYLEQQANSARTFKGWMTRYEKQMRDENIPFDAIQAKIEAASKVYLTAKTAAGGGKLIDKGLHLQEAWSVFKNSVSSATESVAQTNAAIREIVSDPRIDKYIEKDRPDVDLRLFLGEQSLDVLTKTILGNTLPVELGTFLVNYSYNATKWYQSRKQILDRYHLTETELKAVDSVKCQMERTQTALKKCRERTGPLQKPIARDELAPPEASSAKPLG